MLSLISFSYIRGCFVILQVMAHSTPAGILDDVAMESSVVKNVLIFAHTPFSEPELINRCWVNVIKPVKNMARSYFNPKLKAIQCPKICILLNY